MSKLEKQLTLIVAICSISLIVTILILTVENNHLTKENAKFKHEIEYLRDSNELLQEDNVKFQDALWNYHEKKMKEGLK